jgi:hypothetical protein
MRRVEMERLARRDVERVEPASTIACAFLLSTGWRKASNAAERPQRRRYILAQRLADSLARL